MKNVPIMDTLEYNLKSMNSFFIHLYIKIIFMIYKYFQIVLTNEKQENNFSSNIHTFTFMYVKL